MPYGRLKLLRLFIIIIFFYFQKLFNKKTVITEISLKVVQKKLFPSLDSKNFFDKIVV